VIIDIETDPGGRAVEVVGLNLLDCLDSFIFFRFYFLSMYIWFLFLFNSVIYVFLLLCLCILIVCLCMATLTEVFSCFILSCKANAKVKPAKTGHGPHSSKFFCSVYCLFSGESNGNLHLRTCLGCSGPAPYRSPDWVLVPAKPA
jgi:hypothetical protein